MRSNVALGLLVAALAGCSSGVDSDSAAHVARAKATASPTVTALAAAVAHRGLSQIAALPDRGELLSYVPGATVHTGVSTWHQVQLSEDHALHAMASGAMVVQAPDGRPIRLNFTGHVEHADGNWTWVGRPAGAQPGREALLTFGPKAVFGTIPAADGGTLEVTTSAGKTWVVESDPGKMSNGPANALADFLPTPKSAAAAQAMAASAKGVGVQAAGVMPTVAPAAAMPSSVPAAAPAVAMSTIDIVVGYTTAFATRLGGTSQAETRLTSLVDRANQALRNTQLGAQWHLLRTVQVDYADATSNRSALFDLTGQTCTTTTGTTHPQLPDAGVICTPGSVPTALQPLIDAGHRYGADAISLVRIYSDPENQSCGVAWLLGGSQTVIDASSAPYALSVVSDSSGSQFPDNGNTCRDDTLAHELSHNMGAQHDVTTAAGNDDTNGDGNLLDPEEYGRYPDSFGYRTDASAGNFYTVLATRLTGQTPYLVFSNPRITYCGGFACGITGQADNARTIARMAPIVAAFRLAAQPSSALSMRGDFDGDGKADLLWRNLSTGADSVWKSGNAGTPLYLATVADTSWVIVGTGDFNGDHKSDILWRNIGTGQDAIWLSGNYATAQTIATVADQSWIIAGIGDFDGDGKSDILWRNTSTGANVVWKSGNYLTAMTLQTLNNSQWTIEGVADFDGDHKADILWRNLATGANSLWKSGNAATGQNLVPVASQDWAIVGLGDFNGDGKADILWRNGATGQNSLWLSANAATPVVLAAIADPNWTVAGVGDFDGDHKADILWRNSATGADVLWKSGNYQTSQTLSAVPNMNWLISG